MAVSDEGYQHIEHGFEPVFDEHSRVLVLGSFPSVLSRANAFYYGNPQNRFWRVMATCLGMPVPPNEGDPLASGEPATLDASIAAKRAMLLNGGVALWDVVESCDIKGSSDASIRNVVPAHIERITDAAPIEVVACNGGTAGRLYKRYLQDRTGLPAIVLPSTSPANAAWRLKRLVERWREAVDWAVILFRFLFERGRPDVSERLARSARARLARRKSSPSASTLAALPPPSRCACSTEQPMRTAPTSLSIASENGRRKSPMRGERRSAAMPPPEQMTTPPHHNWSWCSHALCRRTAVPRACSAPSCAARIAA